MNYLTLLPPEILAKEIFTKLHQEDLCRLGMTCQSWYGKYQQLMGKKKKWFVTNCDYDTGGIESINFYGINAYTKMEAIKKYILKCSGEYMSVVLEDADCYEDFELSIKLAKDFNESDIGGLDPEDDEYIEFRNKYFNDIAEILDQAHPRIFRIETIRFYNKKIE